MDDEAPGAQPPNDHEVDKVEVSLLHETLRSVLTRPRAMLRSSRLPRKAGWMTRHP
jgi:hypothetical protein